MGNLNLAMMYLPKDHKAYEKLEKVVKSIERAKGLANQLLAFSKGGLPTVMVTTIGKLIKEAASFYLSGSKVKGEFYIPKDLWFVEVEPNQFNQIIQNLVINAIEAMPEGGVLRIRAENVYLKKGEVPLLEEGPYVKIEVSDTGCGIPPENLPKIFDPFFTTKKTGSGLGLAIVYSAIKKFRGHITVQSEVGKGTTFTIYLPAVIPEEITIESEEEEKDLEVKKEEGTKKILLMDDEDEVREVIEEMLKHLGYEVVSVRTGKEAIKVYEEALKRGQKFSAVILDLTVPGDLGGIETLKKLLEIDPEVKAILATGYGEREDVKRYREYGFKGALNKPFGLKELNEVLSTVLKEPS